MHRTRHCHSVGHEGIWGNGGTPSLILKLGSG